MRESSVPPVQPGESSGIYDRYNFAVNAVEGAAWVAGASLVSSQTVLPAIVARLGGGNITIGAVGVITYVGVYLPQIFASRYGQTLEWKKPWVVGFGLAQRVTIFLMGFLILFLAGPYPLTALAFFIILYAINQCFTGLASPVWFDFYAKLTPLRRRGRLVGARNSIAGIMAFICGFLLTWILSTFGFPVNYGIAILLAAVFQMVSIILQWRLIEEYPSKKSELVGLAAYLRQLRSVLRTNNDFRKFVFTSVFLVIATMPIGFFTVYALHHYNAGEFIVGEFTLAMVAGQIVGALGNGLLSDRYGNKTALISSTLSLLAASLWAVFAPSLAWYRLVFVLMGINVGSELMTRYNLAVEYGPVELRSLYVGLMNTLLAPFYCASLAAGVLINWFGYEAIFLGGAACSVIGIALLAVVVREPRTGLA